MELVHIKEFNFLDPQGQEIFCDNFETEEEANTNFEKWMNRFKNIGYYFSPVFGEIDINDLANYCKIVSTELSLIRN